MIAKSTCRLTQNPFAIKAAAPTRSLADSTEGKDAPCGVTSSSPKVFLRPSALAAQAEKLKTVNSAITKPDSDSNRHNLDNENGESKSSDSSVSTSSTTQSSSLFSLNKEEAGTSQSGFVFGQNLHERVITDFVEPKEVVAQEPLPSELTFEAAASNKEVAKNEALAEENEPKPTKSLTESAEEYQSKQVKRKFSEVTVVTGEEEESNVLQISCKLFSFNKTNSSWLEKGRGILRLNDKEVDGVLKSRLVMRTQGSYRVILNSKVWEGMTVDHPSTKTVRISVLDSEGIKVYLVMAGTKDVEQLFSALDWRVTMLKSQEERHGSNLAPKNPVPTPAEHSENANQSASFADSTEGSHANNNTNTSSNSHQAGQVPKRWRSSESNSQGIDGDQPESSTASGSISPAEGDLSSDSGFPAAEDS